MAARRFLILGGTGEGARLARAAVARFGERASVISSLAGRTATPSEIPGLVRVGGFGGVEGLVKYLRDEAIDAVVDATHPFAAAMSRHAVAACARASVPLQVLRRPPWPALAGERRILVPDMAAAAVALGEIGARRIFVTTGTRDLDKLAAVPNAWYLIRLIEPVKAPLPLPHYAAIYARGPFAETADRRLMEEHGIDALLAKHSGGGATFGKILAARELGIPVVMIERPVKDMAGAVDTIDAALAWLETRFETG